ncbi:hypothetical protein ACJX0J_031614, partial [Zea mays]
SGKFVVFFFQNGFKKKRSSSNHAKMPKCAFFGWARHIWKCFFFFIVVFLHLDRNALVLCYVWHAIFMLTNVAFKSLLHCNMLEKCF